MPNSLKISRAAVAPPRRRACGASPEDLARASRVRPSSEDGHRSADGLRPGDCLESFQYRPRVEASHAMPSQTDREGYRRIDCTCRASEAIGQPCRSGRAPAGDHGLDQVAVEIRRSANATDRPRGRFEWSEVTLNIGGPVERHRNYAHCLPRRRSGRSPVHAIKNGVVARCASARALSISPAYAATGSAPRSRSPGVSRCRRRSPSGAPRRRTRRPGPNLPLSNARMRAGSRGTEARAPRRTRRLLVAARAGLPEPDRAVRKGGRSSPCSALVGAGWGSLGRHPPARANAGSRRHPDGRP